jgi:L-asparaginase type II
MTMQSKQTVWSRRLAPLLIMAMLTALLSVTAIRVQAETEAIVLPTFDIPPLSEAHINSPLPNVIVVATGGTLAGAARNGDKTNFQNYAAGTYSMADLIAELPVHKTADVASYQFGNKGSGGYTMKELYDLSLAVDAALEIYDSAVVTTGTDTMEEIAYFLDLTVRSPKPVVVTGAMRPWDVIGTDGPANLYQAIKVAGSNKTKWYGTVVMLNDVIHAAREVTKSNSHRMDTFESPMFGALGYVDDPAVRMYRLNARALKAGQESWATPFDLKKISRDQLPIVDIVYNYQEAGGGAIRALVQDGAKGIVTAGTGAGGISSKMSAARTEAIKQGVTFVSTTRTGSGSIYSGGNGIIAGDNLNPQHARIMLMLSLAFSNDFNTVKGWFETVGTQDITMEETEAPTWPPGSLLEVEASSSASLTLKWPAASDNVAEYAIYMAGQDAPLAKVPANTNTYTVSSLSPSTAYSFVVKAIGSSGLESIGLTGSSTTLAAPSSGGGVIVTNPAEKTEAIINPANGGTLSYGSEITVQIPQGALEAAIQLIIEKLTGSGNWSQGPGTILSPAYEVTKNTEGTFLKPVTLTLTFNSSLLGDGEKASIFYYDEILKQWIEMGGIVNGNRITVETDHFTKFSVFAVADKQEPAPSFHDVSGHWAEANIAAAVSAGFINGYGDGTFRPDNKVTRAEFAVMLTGALKTEASTVKSTFIDEAAIPAWAKEAIASATAQGIVSGYPGGDFRPSASVTRSEMAVMIAKALKLPLDSSGASSYSDKASIPAWAIGAVEALTAEGLMQGRSDNRFAPDATSTRAEAATLLMRVLQYKP